MDLVNLVPIWASPIPGDFDPHLFFFKDFIYLFIRRERDKQREKQAPCREPDVGLDPVSPGSRPGLQAAPNRCATGAALIPTLT